MVTTLTRALAELADAGAALIVSQAQEIRLLRHENARLRQELDEVTDRERDGRGWRA